MKMHTKKGGNDYTYNILENVLYVATCSDGAETKSNIKTYYIHRYIYIYFFCKTILFFE